MKKVLILTICFVLCFTSFASASVFLAPTEDDGIHLYAEGRYNLLDVTGFVNGLGHVCGVPLQALSKVGNFASGYLKYVGEISIDYFNSVLKSVSDYNHSVTQAKPQSGGSGHHSNEITYSPDDIYYMTQYLKSLYPDNKIEGGGNSAIYHYEGLEVESYGISPSTWSIHPVDMVFLDTRYEDIAFTVQSLDYSGYTIDFVPDVAGGSLAGQNLSCRGLSIRDSVHNSYFAAGTSSHYFNHITYNYFYDDIMRIKADGGWLANYNALNTQLRYHGSTGPICCLKYPYHIEGGVVYPTQAQVAEFDLSSGWDSMIYLCLPYSENYQLLACPYNNSTNEVLVCDVFSRNIVLTDSDIGLVPSEPVYSFEINTNNYYNENNDNSVTYNISNFATPTDATATDYTQYLLDANDSLEDIEELLNSLPIGDTIINNYNNNYYSDDGEKALPFESLFNMFKLFFTETIPEYQGLIKHYLPDELGTAGATLLGLATVFCIFRLL